MTLWDNDYSKFYMVVRDEDIVTVTGDREDAKSVAMLLNNARVLVCTVDHVAVE